MCLVKEFKKGNEIVRIFNNEINGGISVKMNGKLYWMLRENSEGVNRWSKSVLNNELNYKKCSNCGVKKDVKYFYVSKNNVDGYSNYCGSCESGIVNKNKRFSSRKLELV